MSDKGTVFVALFSGINVGGNRIVKMAELRAFFEELGFSDVASYVQSGNAVFRARKGDAASLTKQLEAAFEKKWGFYSRIMVRDLGRFERLVKRKPLSAGRRRSDQAPCLCAGARADRRERSHGSPKNAPARKASRSRATCSTCTHRTGWANRCLPD